MTVEPSELSLYSISSYIASYPLQFAQKSGIGFLQNRLLDSRKCQPYVRRVSHLNEVGIEIYMSTIHLIESPKQILRGPVHVIASGIVREVIAQRILVQLLLEAAGISQEQDDGSSHEPLRVDDRVKQHQGHHHPGCCCILEEDFVIAAEVYHEDDTRYTFEVAKPFPGSRLLVDNSG